MIVGMKSVTKTSTVLKENYAKLLFAFVVAFSIIIVVRLIKLQIIEHDYYYTLSEKNRVRVVPSHSARGKIYDRNGVLIVRNKPTYTISIIPAEFLPDSEYVRRLSSLLDVLGATVVGSMVLLMIFTSLFNMQVISYNTQLQIGLTKMSEDLITGRKTGSIDQPGIESILSKVGAGVSTSTDPIIEATSTSFKFLGQTNPTSSVSTLYFVQESGTSEGFPLYVYQNDMSNPIIGPFWMADTLEITYIDMNNNVVNTPDSNHDLIRAIKVSLTFFYDTYQPDIDKRLVRHNIVFWKYFKNLYL